MASKKNLKKSINDAIDFAMYELLLTNAIRPKESKLDIQENIVNCNTIRHEYIMRINHAEPMATKKQVRAYYRKLIADFNDSLSKVFSALEEMYKTIQ